MKMNKYLVCCPEATPPIGGVIGPAKTAPREIPTSGRNREKI